MRRSRSSLGTATVQPRVRRPLGLAFGPDGALYVAESEGTTVVRVDPRTHARTVAARGLAQPLYVAFDPDGRLVVVDSRNRTEALDLASSLDG